MQKGNSLSRSDGAGHVMFIEEVFNENHIYTSESAYGGLAFYNCHRYNTNGRWGMAEGYSFRGVIVNPYVQPYKMGDYVKINGVYRSSMSETKLTPLVTTGKITAILPEAKNPYLLNDGLIGWVNSSVIVSKVDEKIEVGDKVKVINPYDEKGRRLSINGNYDVIEVVGNRVVIGKGNVVTAAIFKENLQKI